MSTSSSILNKGKGRQVEIQKSSIAARLQHWDDSSSSTTKYYEVPSNHFLARSGGHASTSSVNILTNRRSSHDATSLPESKSSHKESFGEPATAPLERVDSLESGSLGSLSSTDRNALSHVPEGISQSFLSHAGQASGGQQPRPFMPDTTTLAAADFDIDVRSGFLPPQAPISRLEGIEEEFWETALDRAKAIPLRIGGGGSNVSEAERKAARAWRRSIREMLILHPSPQLTTDIRFARRAHLVLSWLAHMYIHSQPTATDGSGPSSSSWFPRWSIPSQDDIDKSKEEIGTYSATIPAAIAVPWVALSNHLDLPPILTYATCVLWNWDLRDPLLGYTDDNMFITTTFSNTPSEEHFYKTSLLIERKGVTALTLMRRSLDEAFVGDALARRRISVYLQRLSRVIAQLTQVLHDVRLGCDPQTFYWGIRPWFNGSDSFQDKQTGEKGWIYEGVEEYGGKRMVFTGPSAGQSSLIHSLDVFLGIDHSQKKREGGSSSEKENATFMEKMQTYMPGHHRNFLTHLKSISFVEGGEGMNGPEEDEDDADDTDDEQGKPKEKVERHPLRALMIGSDSTLDNTTFFAVEMLRKSYNEALDSLKHLRDEHMRIAALYIISQMKLTPPREYSRLNEDLVIRLKQPDSVESDRKEKGAKGTGGTDLVSFLKDCRKNTIAALYALPN